MARELKVIQDFYDFVLWLTRHTEKFPRHHRYSLGMAMENRLQRILELLLRAKYSRTKSEHLNDANMELEVLRFQVRLATDLKALPAKSHGHAAEAMWGIGSFSWRHEIDHSWQGPKGGGRACLAPAGLFNDPSIPRGFSPFGPCAPGFLVPAFQAERHSDWTAKI